MRLPSALRASSSGSRVDANSASPSPCADVQRARGALGELEPTGIAVVQQRDGGRSAHLLERRAEGRRGASVSIMIASESTVMCGVERGMP